MSKKEVRWRRMHLPKIETIKLSEKNIGLRAFAVGVLLLIAALALGSALTDFLNTDPGWQTVEVESDAVNVSTEFQFNYDFSVYGGAASNAYKQMISVYSKATEEAYRIFHEEVDSLNDHVNEPVSVDPVLYEALNKIADSGNRHIYLAPVYQEYNGIFLSGNSGEAEQFDPSKNQDMLPYITAVASYVNDSEMIGLEMLGENQVCLRVSDDYLAFAQEYEIEKFVDLNWMTNAFVVDYLAQTMIDNGYTCGYIASYDGFTRNLDTRGNSYNFNLYDRRDRTIYPAGILKYDRAGSIVSLRAYPMDANDWLHYYEFADGSVTSVYIDPADGMSKASVENLVCYSFGSGCAELLLKAAPVLIADDFQQAGLNGVSAIWMENQTIRTNDMSAKIEPNQEYGYTLMG